MAMARGCTCLALAYVLLTTAACALGPTNCGTNKYAYLRAALPPSATAVRESCSNFADPVYEVTFTMAPQDLARFQQSTRVQNWNAHPAAVTAFKDQAARAQSLLFGTYADSGFVQDILIDTSDPQQYKVYYHSLSD
jgi:hypothetical protein